MKTLRTIRNQALAAGLLVLLSANAVAAESIAIIVSDGVSEKETNADDLRKMLNGEVMFWPGNERIKIVMQELPDCYVEQWRPANRTDACSQDSRTPSDFVTCQLADLAKADFDALWLGINYRDESPDLPEWVKPNELSDELEDADYAMAFVCDDAIPTLRRVKILPVRRIDDKVVSSPGDQGYPLMLTPSDWCPLRIAAELPGDDKGAIPPARSLALTGHTNDVTSVAFAPDGKTLASGSWDNTVRLWRRDRGGWRPLGKPLKGHQKRVTSIAVAPDGKSVASGSGDTTIRLWQFDGQNWGPLGKPLTGHKDNVSSVAFAPDGKTLASASWDKTVRLWQFDGQDWKPLGLPLKGHKDDVTKVAFAPDGETQTLASGSDDNTVRLWRPGAEGWESLGEPLKGHDRLSGVTSVAFAPDGKTLASGSDDNTVRLWRLDDQGAMQLAERLRGHDDNVTSVAFAPDGKTLASGSDDNTVRLWRLDDQGAMHCGELLRGHGSQVTSVAFAPDGKTVASSARWEHLVRLWPLDRL